MTPRLDFVKANPAAMKAMISLEEHISQSGLAKSLAELVRHTAKDAARGVHVYESDRIRGLTATRS